MRPQPADPLEAKSDIASLRRSRAVILRQLKGDTSPAVDAIDAFHAKRRGAHLMEYRLVRVQNDLAAIDAAIARLEAGLSI